VGVDSTNH